jgi:hypothetical protein
MPSRGALMNDIRQIIPATGLLGTVAIAAYMVVQLDAQTPASGHDFTKAAAAEVRDAQGAIILSGRFGEREEEDDDIERVATLESTGSDSDAAGDAEIEFAARAPREQEVEFAVRNVTPRTALTFSIDGVDVATATADERGRVEIEVTVRMPGAPAR